MKRMMIVALVSLVACLPAWSNDGAAVFKELKCMKCHEVTTLDIKTTAKDPKKSTDLADVGNQREEAWLFSYLKKEVEKDGKKHKMKFKGDEEQMKIIVAWLLTLKK